MIRMILSDAQWERGAPHLPGKVGHPGRSGVNNRLFFEEVLWIVRTGAPWRDIDPALGVWNSIFQRFNRWSKKGVFERIFASLSDDPGFEYAIVDGTIVRVHQHGTGAKGGLKIRRSAIRAAVQRRRSSRSSMRSAISPASFSCPAIATTVSA